MELFIFKKAKSVERKAALFSLIPTLFLLIIPINSFAVNFPNIAENSTSSNTSGGTSHTVSLPIGITSGDLLIMAYYGSATDGTPSTAATGWTKIKDLNVTNAVGHLAILYRIADGTEGSTVSVTTDTSEDSAHTVYRINNWHGSSAPEVSSGFVNVSTNPDPDSLTPSWGAEDTLWIAVGAIDRTKTIDSFPTDYSLSQISSATFTSNGGGLGMGARHLNASSENPGTFSASASDRTAAVTVGVRPGVGNTTTLGDGTDPGNSTIAPGASATEIDRFSLVTNTGTDTVTGMTVTLGPANAYTNIATVDVQTTGGSSQCSATPSSNTVNLTSCGIGVTTSSTEYKIMITPKSHANMAAPATGASYDTTATVTSITATNSTAGTDTDSATITVDNLSPGNVTSATATGGDTQVSLSWTNPGDSDLSRVMVVASTSAITFTPTEGTTYSTTTLNGASRVACYGLQTSCTDTSLSNGTAYYYKIFTLDSNGNWSDSGVTPTGSPVTAGSVTVTIYASAGDGTVASRNQASWAAAQGATTGTDADPTGTFITISANENPFSTNQWSVNRALLPFDTSSIPSGSTIVSASLSLNVISGGIYDLDGEAEDYSVVVESFQPDETTFTTADIELVGDAIDNPTEGSNQLAFTAMTDDAYNTWTLNSTGLGWIKKSGEASSCGATSGFTCLGIRVGLDVEDITPATNENSGFDARSSETTGTSQDPYLTITYIPPTPTLDQLHYRWRSDNGTETGATYPLAEDTAISSNLFLGDRIRLRFLVSNTGGTATDYTYQLEHSSSSCTAWIPVPTNESATPHWVMGLSSYLNNGFVTTNSGNLTDPGGGSFVAGYYVEHPDNTTPAHTLDANEFSEFEFAIRSTAYATVGTTYCFRLTNAGDTSEFTYTVTPQVAVSDVIIRPSAGGESLGGEGNGVGPVRSGGGTSAPGGSLEGTGSGPSQGGGGPGGGGGGDLGFFFESSSRFSLAGVFYSLLNLISSFNLFLK